MLFVHSQMSRSCLKLLEDREIGFVSKKDMRDSIFQILSILCKEYIFGLSLMPRLIQVKIEEEGCNILNVFD